MKKVLCTLLALTSTLLSIAPVSSVWAQTATRPAKPAEKRMAAAFRTKADQILNTLETDGDFPAARASLLTLWDQTIAYASDRDLMLFRDVDFARRMVDQLATVADSTARRNLLKYLRRNQELAYLLAYMVRPNLEKPAEVYAVLERLRAERGDKAAPYAALTTALCVVHDGPPFVRQINENLTTAPDVLAIFDYFLRNEQKMFFGIKNVPPELLVYVVDTTTPIAEMEWALGNYANDSQVGKRFFDISYDFDHFLKDKPKKLSAVDYTLPNIRKLGGICADQAYFAVAVGKAIGVPTAYTRAVSAEGGHAWVGFLQAVRGQGFWNFDVGRYEEYRGIRGSVLEPQSRRWIPDNQVSLLAELIGSTAADRQCAGAMTDAAVRLIRLEQDGQPFTVAALDEPLGDARAEPRQAGPETELALLELGLKQCSAHADGWFAVRELAKDGKLTLDQKKRWAGVLDKLCGSHYPDFVMAVLSPMVQTVSDVKEQNILWNNAFTMFQNQRRADLAAEARLGQAKMWETAGELNKAGQCYEDIIDHFANDGPFVLEALARAEKILKDMDQNKVLLLYDQTWSKIHKPKVTGNEFSRQSVWYQVGSIYSERLALAGDAAKAAAVQSKLDAVSGTR
jgi:hypothetical protein